MTDEDTRSPQELITEMMRMHAECVRERRKHISIIVAIGVFEASMVVLCMTRSAEREGPMRWFFFFAGLLNAWGFVRSCFSLIETWQILTKVERRMRYCIIEALAELRRIGGEV